MSANARRYAAKPAQKIEVPKVPHLTDAQRAAMPLADRLLHQEHARHADRLAAIRAIAAQLPELDAIVQAAQADGAEVDIAAVGPGAGNYRRHAESPLKGVRAVRLWGYSPILTEWRRPVRENAIANALLRAGWQVVYARAHGSELSLDRVVFMRGRRAVETNCMRQWVLDAIEAGHITAETEGNHPARNEPIPLNA